jgi:PTS system nitrogen regulatory IIA component
LTRAKARRALITKLHDLLSADMIVPDILARDKDAAVKEMARLLKEKGKVRKEQELFENLMQREKLGSTAIGDGIAIPHCKLKEVEIPVLLLAISRKGIPFGASDARLTHIFFLVVSSPDDPRQNLEILAAIAHLVRQAGSLPRRIMAAKNPSKILEIIREEEKRLEG